MRDPRHYRFEHTQVVPAPRALVYDVLLDLERYPEWWPQVRAVLKVDDDHAVVVARSALPYALEMHLHAARREPGCVEVAISGAMEGFARYRLDEQGPDRTRLRFEQEVRVRARMLCVGSFLARPLLTWNHARMMRGAEEGLARRVDQKVRPASRPA